MGIMHEMFALTKAMNIMHTGAHPDDEDSGIISYLSGKFGARIFYWSANRGEKGQNHISDLTETALGILRTWESVDAAAINRSECLFGPFIDFGFVKTADDTISRWNNVSDISKLDWKKEVITKCIVREIRKYKPWIIISRWNGDKGDFHGHHQAIGLATKRAFELAADATYYPELEAEGILPWQPLKLYVSLDNSGGDQLLGSALNTSGLKNVTLEAKPNVLAVNTGSFDPYERITYQEKAWAAYSKHRSQGMAQLPKVGDFMYYFYLEKNLCKGDSLEFIDNIPNTLPELLGFLKISNTQLSSILDEAQAESELAFQNYKTCLYEESVKSLLAFIKKLRTAIDSINAIEMPITQKTALLCHIEYKVSMAQNLIFKITNIKLEAFINRMYVIPGDNIKLSMQLVSYGDIIFNSTTFTLRLPSNVVAKESNDYDFKLSPNDPATSSSVKIIRQDYTASVSHSNDYGELYWLKQPRNGDCYQWPNDSKIIGSALGTKNFLGTCTMLIDDVEIKINVPFKYRESSSSHYRMIEPHLLPPVSIKIVNEKEFRSNQDIDQVIKLKAQVRCNSYDNALDCTLRITDNTNSFEIQQKEFEVSLSKYGEIKEVEFLVTIPAATGTGDYKFYLSCICDGVTYDNSVVTIMQGHDGIELPLLPNDSNCVRHTIVQKAAIFHLIVTAVNFEKNLKYAYIVGENYYLTNILRSLNIDIAILSDDEIAVQDLSEFDAIIVGPNAYLVRPVLRDHNSKILEYVHDGGTLIVQYQKYLYADHNYTPYPFKYNMPHDRVTNQNAPVEVLDPEHWLVNYPNKITQADFEGWISDRGLYFWHEWDERYIPLLACADTGELKQQGGLLHCGYGLGTYIYTGYSFFRQIAAGVPGAIKFFANILATPQSSKAEKVKLLLGIKIFSELDNATLLKMAHISFFQQYNSGQYICQQGDLSKSLYIIHSGVAEILEEKNDMIQRITELSSGGYVGELAFLDRDGVYHQSLRAVSNLYVLGVEKEDFLKILQDDSHLAAGIIQVLSKELSTLNNEK